MKPLKYVVLKNNAWYVAKLLYSCDKKSQKLPEFATAKSSANGLAIVEALQTKVLLTITNVVKAVKAYNSIRTIFGNDVFMTANDIKVQSLGNHC